MIVARIDNHDLLPSTSLHARALIEANCLPRAAFAVTARVQAGGIGRFGRAWKSPRGGLWLTLAQPLDAQWVAPPALGLGIAVACAHAVEAVVPSISGRVQIKWPNDLMLADRKLAGILIERMEPDSGAWLLVGVGVNANVRIDQLPPELRDHATTLLETLGEPVDLPALREAVIARLVRTLERPDLTPAALRDARARQWGIGMDVGIKEPGRPLERAVVSGIADDGRLTVRVNGVESVVSVSAEVTSRWPGDSHDRSPASSDVPRACSRGNDESRAHRASGGR